eukprot:7983210-Alexandrium_andersonii.AAC.1
MLRQSAGRGGAASLPEDQGASQLRPGRLRALVRPPARHGRCERRSGPRPGEGAPACLGAPLVGLSGLPAAPPGPRDS